MLLKQTGPAMCDSWLSQRRNSECSLLHCVMALQQQKLQTYVTEDTGEGEGKVVPVLN